MTLPLTNETLRRNLARELTLANDYKPLLSGFEALVDEHLLLADAALTALGLDDLDGLVERIGAVLIEEWKDLDIETAFGGQEDRIVRRVFEEWLALLRRTQEDQPGYQQ